MSNNRVRYLYKSDGKKVNIESFPSFSATGNITGMKRLHYGESALLVRCGSYIYNVTNRPNIYYMAH